MTAVIHKISVGAGGKHALSPEESRLKGEGKWACPRILCTRFVL